VREVSDVSFALTSVVLSLALAFSMAWAFGRLRIFSLAWISVFDMMK
jgi:hypothetical protein